ncbi:CRISPR-associated protein TM1810 domain protein [Flexistipes sinusarabici DSM 4947]|uniref:CRISPR system Cms protein Csm2 n=1 Tax=Flexistipes sinusarabici (strain ATCC 49648 / DSM 4947 / MAS 10) TaxID=717231 RepID=F8E7K5_FLESM|nr:type III-A CRISPR-associated protein Csm2 [Flexistipes sinusarabici]AEI14992.1 CRISPR-associated protein TM1810 domain protein [Flexistipes sinusarabici DSM 4947]
MARQENSSDVVKTSFKKYEFSDLIKTKAKEVAELMKKEHDDRKINKNSQIRKFFDDLYSVKNTIDSSSDKEKSFNENLPMIYLVASKGAYAKGRKHIGQNFYNFLSNNITTIDTLDDFEKFISYFEAILGYYRYLNPKEN